MASLTKTERALRGPGLFEITLGVVLSIILGVVLAVVHLVFKPVETVKEMPKDPVAGTVYYLEGSTDTGKARRLWTRKRQMLGEAGPVDVSFSEEELNAWVASAMPQTKPATTAKSAAAPSKSESSGFSIVPDRPNFRIRDGVLQLGIPSTVNLFGLSLPLVVQARGNFVPGDAGFVFKADKLYVGSLPAQSVPGLKDLFIRRALAAQEIPEDLSAAWKKLKLVAVEGSVLRLSLP